MKKTVLSGIQSNGDLHLGNYLGAINNWLKIQDIYDCYFFLADLHSITIAQNPSDLRNSVRSAASMYLASGIDPKKSTIFIQSSVKEHTQLAWILNCMTPISWLSRMTQFKDKSVKDQGNANSGLFIYPVLMAADILLYNANLVPVGDDQKQHLELTRDIAGLVNRKIGKEILTIPEPLIHGTATRVMSLRDGTKKMSKSDISDSSRINLTDSAEIIRKKIKKAKTDNIAEITYDLKLRPEISNLINIFCALSEKKYETIVKEYRNRGFASFKNDLAELIISKTEPINLEYRKIMKDQTYIDNVLLDGKKRSEEIASKTYNKVAKEFGLL